MLHGRRVLHPLPPLGATRTCDPNFLAFSTSRVVRVRTFSISARLRISWSVSLAT